MEEEQWGFDTLKIRGAYRSQEHNYSVIPPVYQTAAFDLGDTARLKRLFAFEEAGFRYSRVGNPNADLLEKRMSLLDGASAAVATCSGMSAITYTLLNVAEGGGRILTSLWLYGGTLDSFSKIYRNFGITVDQVENQDDPDAFRRAIREDTKAIFIESISNPNAAVADIEAIARVAQESGIPLIVDNTLATPYLLAPIRYGADIVIYSATKALNGHGNSIAGLVLESGHFEWRAEKFPQFHEKYYTLRDPEGRPRDILEVFPDAPFTARIRLNYQVYFGAALSPVEANLTLLGLETLSERVSKQVASTEKLVRFLENHDKVLWVKHPSAAGSPYRARAAKYLPRGAGSVFTFGPAGTPAQIEQFLDALRIFSFHNNVGDARSLVTLTPRTTHGELTPGQQLRAGIPPNTVRLSIGLEDADDLIADLSQAFQKAFARQKIEERQKDELHSQSR